MAMKKAEMESHRERYRKLMHGARAAQREGLYNKAVADALASWDHIDGMMQYERRYEDREFDTVESIDLVLKYAPLLLDFRSLDRLESLLKTYRRIDKNTSGSMADKLTHARNEMWDAHRLWSYLERHPDTLQSQLAQVLGRDQAQWRSAAETWEAMGLLRRTPADRSYTLALSTRMGQVVQAKCPSCGAVADGPKAMFFEVLSCPDCQASVSFVLLNNQAREEE